MRIILTIYVEQFFIDVVLTASQKHENTIQVRNRREDRSRNMSQRVEVAAIECSHE